jgi:hypothetical protein
MSPAAEVKQKSPWKNPLIYSSAVLLIAAFYVGWILLSRAQENRSIEQRARDAAAKKQIEQDRATVEQMGGSELAIQSFYGNPTVHRGQSAQLCYGVANAKKVTLQPQASPVWPSYSRCVDVTPTKTTTYTLTASDEAGHSVSQTFTVKVQ